MKEIEEQLEKFSEPKTDGILHIPDFLSESELENIWEEIDDPVRVKWRDNHSTFENKRGLKVVQNHDVYALKLSDGDHEPLRKIPHLRATKSKITRFVHSLWDHFPTLIAWQPDELVLHRYDDRKVGLSRHKAHTKFVGVIAIASLEGECDLAIYKMGGKRKNLYPTKPGDLTLLRAPELFKTDKDIRPEHAVINLRTPVRTSMMLRDNNRPKEILPGAQFENWQPEEKVEIRPNSTT